MELLYEIKSSSCLNTSPQSIVPQRSPICTVSVRNLVAFTSFVDLIKKPNSFSEHVGPPSSNSGSHVYVADLNTPWECHLVKNSTPQVIHLQWDHSGVKLLVGSVDGKVEVYSMVDHLLNKWHVLYGGSFEGEPILSSCWLSIPRKVCVVPDKLDCMLYSDKYQVSLTGSSRGFGGKALDGCVIVTATGLLGAMVHSSEDTSKVITAVEKMIAVRSQIVCTDMAYSKDGDIVVVSSSDKMKQPVQLNRVSVKLFGNREKAEIVVNASQSLFLPNLSDHSISTIQFGSKTSTDVLIVCLTNRENGSSLLCLYELVAHPVALKPRFQNSNDLMNASRWQQKSQVQFGSTINEMCSLHLHLISQSSVYSYGHQNQSQSSSYQQTNAAMTPLTALSLSNGTVVLVRCDNLQQVGVINPSSSYKQGPITNISLGFPMKRERDRDDGSDSKMAKFSSFFSNSGSSHSSGGSATNSFSSAYVSMEFTWSGSLLVALDHQSHLHIYKIHPNIDAGTAATLMELSMIGGLDPWDIMMSVRQNLIENIADRLSETFARQPQTVQQHYNVRILVMKAALYRLTCGGTARTNDQQTLLTLHLVSGALKSLLRPRDLSSHDKGPAESLSGLLSAKGEALSDINKVLVHIVATEYAVEAPTLQSVQQFLQWCADLALKLLATLPDLRHSRAPGWEVCRDSKAVGTLRELIVLMRIWGLIRPSCLPYFRKTSESLDVLPLLFRLLTRLSVAPHDPDEALIDECCLLPSEVQIPSYNAYSSSKNHGLASSPAFLRNSPMQLEFGVNPMIVMNTSEGNGENWIDGLRLMWLGKNPVGVKVCNRCGCATLIQLPPRSAANKAWDQRWFRSCPCGGNWKIPSYLPQPKAIDPDTFLNF